MKGIKGSVGGHFVNGRHFLNSFPDGGKVGKHTTGPALGHVRHVDGLHFFRNDIFGLLLGSHKKDLASALGDLLHGRRSFIQFCFGLVEVNDVDSVLLHKYIRSHGRIPLSLQVSKMHTCIQ